MNATRILNMQPFRAAAARQMQPALRATSILRPAAARAFHHAKPSPRVAQPIMRKAYDPQARPFHNSRTAFREKEEDQSAHTITQRLKQLKRIPPELLPLAVVLAFALFAAGFAMIRKLITDKTLRLKRETGSH